MSMRQVPHSAGYHISVNDLFLVEAANQEQTIYVNVMSHSTRHLPHSEKGPVASSPLVFQEAPDVGRHPPLAGPVRLGPPQP